MTEEELIKQAQSNDMYLCNQIIKNYEKLIETKVHTKGYRFYSDDYQELMQCGRLAVYKGILSYDNSKSKFATYVSHIIDNELSNYLRQLNAQKNKINTDSLPLNNQGEIEIATADGDTTFIACQSEEKTPEMQMLDDETLTYVLQEVGLKLSAKEYDVLKLHLQGLKQKEIAEELHISTKSVETAIARARTKIKI